MAIIAKARLMNKGEKPSIAPILDDVSRKSVGEAFPGITDDPLRIWFSASGAIAIRRVEYSIQRLLVEDMYRPLAARNIADLSHIASFFYVALFRTVRALLTTYYTSNPMWVREPRGTSDRLEVDQGSVLGVLRRETDQMVAALDDDPFDDPGSLAEVRVEVASSDSLPLEDESVDFILTSPPYCTRMPILRGSASSRSLSMPVPSMALV